MEIGYPTDVKHVAHIGWDGPSGSAPSWVRSPHKKISSSNHLSFGAFMFLFSWKFKLLWFLCSCAYMPSKKFNFFFSLYVFNRVWLWVIFQMNEFKTAPDFSATSLGNIGERRDSNPMALSTWSSQGVFLFSILLLFPHSCTATFHGKYCVFWFMFSKEKKKSGREMLELGCEFDWFLANLGFLINCMFLLNSAY